MKLLWNLAEKFTGIRQEFLRDAMKAKLKEFVDKSTCVCSHNQWAHGHNGECLECKANGSQCGKFVPRLVRN